MADNDMHDDDLEKVQEELTQAEFNEREKEAMKVENRSIYTIQDTIVKKAKADTHRPVNSGNDQ